MESTTKDDTDFHFRVPTTADAQIIHTLIKNSPPLDLNSLYTYLLLTDHYSSYCVVAEKNNEVAGFISGYPHPKKEDTWFLWQVVVAASARKQGLAHRMITSLFEREEFSSFRFIETTVTPDNEASESLFRKVARGFSTSLDISEGYTADLFGGSGHEEERLFRIGPLQTN